MVVWDPNEAWGGLDGRRRCRRAKLILWKGHCSVHTRFTVRADRARSASSIPAARSSCIPKCTFDVVQAADDQRLDRVHHQHGQEQPVRIDLGRRRPRSTSSTASPNEVAPDKTVVTLDPFGCLCSTMFRVSPNHLLWMLEGLVDGTVVQSDHRARATEEFRPPRARSDADGLEAQLQPSAFSWRNELC